MFFTCFLLFLLCWQSFVQVPLSLYIGACDCYVNVINAFTSYSYFDALLYASFRTGTNACHSSWQCCCNTNPPPPPHLSTFSFQLLSQSFPFVDTLLLCLGTFKTLLCSFGCLYDSRKLHFNPLTTKTSRLLFVFCWNLKVFLKLHLHWE